MADNILPFLILSSQQPCVLCEPENDVTGPKSPSKVPWPIEDSNFDLPDPG